MGAPLQAGEVIEIVDALVNEYSVFHDDNRDRLDLTYLRALPSLPRDIAREKLATMLDPAIIDTHNVIMGDVLTFPTEIGVTPFGKDERGEVPREYERKADASEGGGATWYSKLNPNRRLDRAQLSGQLLEPLAITILEAGGIDSLDPYDRFPYRAFCIDLETCGWEEIDGIPTMFGRRFKVRVSEAQRQYRRRSGPHGRSGVPTMKGDRVTWVPVSDDYSPRHTYTTGGGFREMEVAWFDDGEYIYHVGLNESPTHSTLVGPNGAPIPMRKRSGEMLWCGPNPFGRVSAFLCPSVETNARNPEDHYLPFLLPLMTTTAQINYVRSLRATRSRNAAAPRNYVNVNPELGKGYFTPDRPLPVTEHADGKTPWLPGKVEPYPIQPDPDLDKLAEELRDVRDRYGAKALEPLDQDTLKQATAAGILTAMGQAGRYVSPLVGARSTVIRQMLEAWEYSKTYFGDYFAFDWAAGDEEYIRTSRTGSLKANSRQHIDADTFDFPHVWHVTTKSRTPAQVQAEIDIAIANMQPLPDGSPGVGTRGDVMAAAGYTDPGAQNRKKVKEMAVLQTMQHVMDQARVAAEAVIAINGPGINLGFAQQLVTGLQQQQAANGAAPVQAPGPGPAAAPARPTGNMTRAPGYDAAEGAGGPEVI